MSFNIQNFNLIKKNNYLNFFIGATFIAAVFQDLIMVLSGLYAGLPFGFHQNYLNNPFVGLYFFKGAKYLFFMGALFLSVANISWCMRANTTVITSFIFIPSVIVTLLKRNYLLIALGIKATLPVFAYFIGKKINDDIYRSIVKLIKISLWVNFFIALLQQCLYFSILNRSNQEFPGLLGIFKAIRSGGAFLEPNTLGLYGLISLLILLIGARFKLIKSTLIHLSVAYLLIVMSWSRTAMVAATFTLLIFTILPKRKEEKNKIKYLFALALILIFILMLIGRGFDSILIRLNDFYVLLFSVDFYTSVFGRGFGYGTLSSQTYSHLSHHFSVLISNSDSQWIAFYIQGGYWLLFSLLGIFLWGFIRGSFEVKVLLINMFLVGLGIQFIEAWPFGFFTFMLIGFCLQRKQRPSTS